jgi:NAD(P)H-dependent FMN reductase
MTTTVLAFSGSTRPDSLNQKLLHIAASGAEAAGARVVHVRLADYPMPFYDTETERHSGVPENAQKFQALLANSDALLIASPEYNGGYSAVLKNVIDWSSRSTKDGTPGLALFANKPVAVISSSPGPLGGSKGQIGLRAVLEKIGMLSIPQSFALGQANGAFTADNQLKDENVDNQVRAVGEALAKIAAKLR